MDTKKHTEPCPGRAAPGNEQATHHFKFEKDGTITCLFCGVNRKFDPSNHKEAR